MREEGKGGEGRGQEAEPRRREREEGRGKGGEARGKGEKTDRDEKRNRAQPRRLPPTTPWPPAPTLCAASDPLSSLHNTFRSVPWYERT